MIKVKNLVSILLVALSAQISFAAKIDQDELILQKPGSSANKKIKMGSGQIIYDTTANKMKFSNDNGASSKNLGSGSGGGSGLNLLADFNNDFESALSGTWTASGGAASQVTSGGNLLFGAGSGLFNASASAQTFSSNAVSIPNGLLNQNGLAYCSIKTAATDYKLQVVQVSTVIAENVIPAISGTERVYVPFVFPGSGNVFLRAISQSDAADLVLDECYLGSSEAKEFSQASLFGTATDQASCQYSNSTAGSWQDMPQVTGTCGIYSFTGKLSTSGSVLPSFQIADMPAGNYKIDVTGAFVCANSGTNQNCNFSLYDGTTRYNAQNIISSVGTGGFIGVNSLSFLVSKGAASSNQIFKLQSYVNNQATLNVDGTSGTSTSPLVFSVYRFPSGSEQVQRVNEQPSYAIVKSVQTLTDTITAGTFTNFSNASFASGTKTYLGSAAACSSPNSANDICLRAGYLKQGVYDVYVTAGFYSTSTAECVLELYDGAASIGQVYVVPPNVASAQASNTGLHGMLVVNAPTQNKEIVFRAKQQSGSGGCTLISSSGSGDIELGIKPSTMSIADYVLKNSKQVVSSAPWLDFNFAFGGATYASTDCTSSPCTLYNSSGGVTSVTRTGVGQYTINFQAGLCATPINCQFSSRATSASAVGFPDGTPSTTTAFSMGNHDLNGADINAFVNAHCSCQKQ